MAGGKFKLELDKYEAVNIFDGLNLLRNEMIQQQRDTSYVDELMLRIANEKKSGLRVADEKGCCKYEAR